MLIVEYCASSLLGIASLITCEYLRSSVTPSLTEDVSMCMRSWIT